MRRAQRGRHERRHDCVSSEFATRETGVLVRARTRINCGQCARFRSFCSRCIDWNMNQLKGATLSRGKQNYGMANGCVNFYNSFYYCHSVLSFNLWWDSDSVSFSVRSRKQKDPIDANSSEFTVASNRATWNICGRNDEVAKRCISARLYRSDIHGWFFKAKC